MVQHESLGSHFFFPIGQDKNGDYVNVGLFRDIDNAPDLSYEDNVGTSVIVPNSHSALLERILLVVASLPEENTWSGRLLALLYTNFAAKVNDVVDITGVYYEGAAGIRNDRMEYPYHLSSLHVLSIREVKIGTGRQLVDWETARVATLSAIKTVLGVDHKKATLLMLSLISRIASRTTGLLSSLLIGYLPLNIRLAEANSSTAIVPFIVSFLRRIFPRSCMVPLNLEALEGSILASRMNYETGELERGLLQVPDDTLVIIDETSLEAGKLSESATRSLQSLVEFVSHQRVSYEFGSHQVVGVTMNNPVIVLSLGKTILPVEDWISVPTEAQDLHSDVDSSFISNYLGACRGLEVNILTDTANAIHSLFMGERGGTTAECLPQLLPKPSAMDVNEFGAILNITRLLAASYGCTEVTPEHFVEARSLIKS